MISIFSILVVIITNYICWLNFYKSNISRILSICIWIVYIFWYTIPGIAYFILQLIDSPAYNLFYSNLIEGEFEKAFLIENASVLIVLFFFRHSFSSKNTFELYEVKKSTSVYICVVYLIIISYQLLNILSTTNFNYIEANIGDNYGEGSLSKKLIFELEIIFKSFLIILIFKEKNNDKFKYTYYLLIFLGSLLPFLSGNRSAILILLIIFIINLFVKEKELSLKKIRYLLLTFTFTVFIIFPIFLILETTRQYENFDADVVVEQTSQSQKINLFLVMVFTKLDFYSTGALLIRDEGYNQAGFTPYIGSFLSFMPRNLVDRPIAGSYNNTIYGHPSRIPPQVIGHNSRAINVGVSPVHIAIWHFGNFGILLFILVTLGYFHWLNFLFNTKSLLFNMIGIYSMSLPLLNQLIPAPDVIVKIVTQSIVYLIFFSLIAKINVKK